MLNLIELTFFFFFKLGTFCRRLYRYEPLRIFREMRSRSGRSLVLFRFDGGPEGGAERIQHTGSRFLSGSTAMVERRLG